MKEKICENCIYYITTAMRVQGLNVPECGIKNKFVWHDDTCEKFEENAKEEFK